MALLLVATLTLAAGCARLPLPGRPSGEQSRRPASLAVSAPSGKLQELPPPGAVQQFKAELDGRQPRLQIVAPSNGSLLPAGPWPLSLRVEDWPLVDAGDLGLGTHVMLQIDDGAPQPISAATEGRASGPGQTETVELSLPELTPGSHRISVYAARPWGEAIKRPGAFDQIQVHRVAATPQTQPAPGSPQLIALSPGGPAAAEPVLIDWLLRDAPLQGLRDGDGRWRLRITINGDSFLVDENSPLWLKGFRPGSNSVVMELLDGLGEPLNPPFNTAVREVVIDPKAPRSPWLQRSLSEGDQQRVLGLAPVDRSTDSRGDQPMPPETSQPSTPQSTAPAGNAAQRSATAKPPSMPPNEEGLEAAATSATTATARPADTPPDTPPDTVAAEAAEAKENSATPTAPAANPVIGTDTATEPSAQPEPPAVKTAPAASLEPPPARAEPVAEVAPEPNPSAATGPTADQNNAAAQPATTPPPSEHTDTVTPNPSAAESGRNPDHRLRPSSNLGGSARELVRDDGSLIQSAPQGWLQNLRSRLER